MIVGFRTAFSAELGGGEYDRVSSFMEQQTVPSTTVEIASYPGVASSLAGTLTLAHDADVVQIVSPGPFAETPAIVGGAKKALEIRAASPGRAVFILGGDLIIHRDLETDVTLNGLLLAGRRIVVPKDFDGSPNRLRKLRIVHCTLVPGLALHRDGQPVSPGEPGLVVECPDTEVEIEWSICGAIRAVETASVRLAHSIVDANSPTGVAYCAPAPRTNVRKRS